TDSIHEDVDAIFTDIDDDEDPDLIVVSGGNEFMNNEKPLQLRIYTNDGNGDFIKNENIQPRVFVNGSCVVAADFDGDGDIDLFVGGQVVPWNYGQNARSFLLENNGKGEFEDVTVEKAPQLQNIGMVKTADWADLDKDGYPELVLAGEWMPVTVFRNKDGTLQKSK